MEDYKIITNNKNWLENNAVTQFKNISKLKNIIDAVALPDLHAGVKSPIGIVLKTYKHIYPHIIGNDIGCGMGLFNTNISLKQYKQDRWVTKLNHIKKLEDIETINPYDEESPIYDLGTIGGGNHFAEFQNINSIVDNEDFGKLNINKSDILILIHSGSRGYGQSILNLFLDFEGFNVDGITAHEYIKAHNNAVLWAKRNRKIVADKLINYLGFLKISNTVIDCTHNFVEAKGDFFIHRKGAVSSECDFVVIPGSRGNLTYIVKPLNDTDISINSISHGAGRKWARSVCKGKIDKKYTRDSIRETSFKSKVVCHDTNLLYQEAPEAYKNIDNIIEILTEHKLIKVIATLKPLITYKG